KMMHLFLIHDVAPKAFAHLHPVQKARTVFEAPLPPLPAGSYHLYADVTHENGFAETLTATAEIPPSSTAMKRLWLGNSAEPICSVTVARMLATNLFFPPDMDDSWQVDTAVNASSPPHENGVQRVANISGGYKIVWENPNPVIP